MQFSCSHVCLYGTNTGPLNISVLNKTANNRIDADPGEYLSLWQLKQHTMYRCIVSSVLHLIPSVASKNSISRNSAGHFTFPWLCYRTGRTQCLLSRCMLISWYPLMI